MAKPRSGINISKALLSAIISLSLLTLSCGKEEIEPAPPDNPVVTPNPGDSQPQPQPQPKPNPDTTTKQPVDDCMVTAGIDNGAVIPNQYIVTYKEQYGDDLRVQDVTSGLKSKYRLAETAVVKTFNGLNIKGFVGRLNSSQMNSLMNDPEVESIEPDKIISIRSGCYTEVSTQTIPWGIKRVGYGNGTGKTAWIIDTGIDTDHPDLNVNCARSKTFIAGTTIDDDHGHGTHVAGIIAAKNNNTGVLGVAANATVVALKVMNKDGKGSVSNVISAVIHIGKIAKAGDVVNMSIGGGTSETLDKEVQKAAEKGILFSVAAGNEHIDASNSSPARVNHRNIFTVSAMDITDTYASFSNYGLVVDFCAPGVKIPSTFKDGGYREMSGTSMATPHVAGLLLLKGTAIGIDGYVKNDPDGKADPIAHK